jgi:cytidine deaminase
MITDDQRAELIRKALSMREYSYVPYSHYAVGAAVLTEDGTVYGGCNIENSSYGATNCAERTAIFKAVSEGHRKLSAVAVCGAPVGEDPSDYAWPCGICRQVMSEFGSADMPVIVALSEADYQEFPLSELLAHSFSADSMKSAES